MILKLPLKRISRAHKNYKLKAGSGTLTTDDILHRKEAKRSLRSMCRQEAAKSRLENREEILNAKAEDSRTFIV